MSGVYKCLVRIQLSLLAVKQKLAIYQAAGEGLKQVCSQHIIY